MILNIKVDLDKLSRNELDRVGRFLGVTRATFESDSKYRRKIATTCSTSQNITVTENVQQASALSFEGIMQDLQLNVGDLHVHVMADGKTYVRLTRSEFKEFTGYDDHMIDHPKERPRKFYWHVDHDTKTVSAFDWLGRLLVRTEQKEDIIDTSYGRPIMLARGAQATWYPDGKIFHFDGHVYRPIELFCNCLGTNNECG